MLLVQNKEQILTRRQHPHANNSFHNTYSSLGMNSQFKLCYHNREYHFTPAQLQTVQPQSPLRTLNRIHNTYNTVGLVLAYTISFGISSRMTRLILSEVHNISISHQTVQNYLKDASVLVWNFMQKYQGPMNDTQIAGDESEQYRPLKQLIERLNRTYKFHARARCGFKNTNGAAILTTLFVAYYNFLRPHSSLNFKTPIHLPELDNITTIQGKWLKMLELAA